MPRTSRNAPCPCGSGLKYKKCCLPKEDAPVRTRGTPWGPYASATAPGARVVEHRGRRLIVSGGSGDVDEGVLDHAADYFERKSRGQGPAQQMVDFCQPLIDVSDGELEGLNKAMSLGMVFWNLALCEDQDGREEMLDDLLGKLTTPEEKEDFRRLARDMVERHRRMFPEMHR